MSELPEPSSLKIALEHTGLRKSVQEESKPILAVKHETAKIVDRKKSVGLAT